MGTMLEQPPRNYHFTNIEARVQSDCEEIKKVAENTGMSVAEVIEVYKITTMNRFINCFVDDGNVWDEQIAGIGELLKDFTESRTCTKSAQNPMKNEN